MPDRDSGYVTDVGYTFGYHAALQPLRARLAFLRAGRAPPRIRTACELGFGQGVSLALHAAASTVQWWGNDLLPQHVEFARSLVSAAGAQAELSVESFEAFTARQDLPAFDFIGLHGVLSWISDENRAHVAAFVRHHLAPGGVVYTGYNALPGWNDMLPLRHLMTEFAQQSGANGTVERIEAALTGTERLLDTHPVHPRESPRLRERFERLRHADRRYLAHEYFNRDWRPLHFAETADLLGRAGLQFVCSAHLPDHIGELNLTPAQRAFVSGMPTPRLRETARDFITNAQFRRDYWARDAAGLTAADVDTAWRQERIVLTTPCADVPERVSGTLGEVRLDTPIHRAVVEALGDHRPRTLETLHAATGAAFENVVDAVFSLCAFDHVAAAQDAAVAAAVRARTAALNAHLVALARDSGDIGVLASPVTGGGIAVDRVEQLLVAASAASHADAASRADYVARFDATDPSRLRVRAARFGAQREGMLRALGVA